MSLFSRSWLSFGKIPPTRRPRSRPSYRPNLEALEDRTTPTLIANQVLPFLVPGGGLPPGVIIPPGTILPPGTVLPPGLTGPTLTCGAVPSALLGPNLQTFAVLAGSTVTNTGPTLITGNVGVSPGNAVTGFPPGIVNPPGTININNGPANTAQAELTTAYNVLAFEPFNRDLTGVNLGGLTLTPGVYHFDSSAQLTGTLTLNGLGDPNARFDFQIGSTLTTASGSSVVVINGGVDNVYWQVGSSATLGTTTSFAGNIFAQSSITLNTGATILCGRVLARTGAVTLDTNTIRNA